MTPLTDEQVKKILLDILVWFRDFCEEKGYRYFITGGTLLGAVRHGGFIPWDDDIDVLMPLEDYKKFLQEDFSDCPYKLISYDLNKQSSTSVTKLYDPTTFIDVERYNRHPFGVHIDLFPLYPLGKSLQGARKIQKAAKTPVKFKTWLIIGRFVRPKNPLHFVPKLMGYAIAKTVGIKRVDRKIAKLRARYRLEESDYVGYINGAERECVEKWQYETPSKILFEGEPFTCCCEPDTFLKGFYGDYMTLPPENKRISHGFKAYVKPE